MLTIKKWVPLFTTQFLGVLNDNVLKNAIIFISIFWLAKDDQGLVIPIASALLVLPFVLFSPLAGRWSQTKSKKKIFELSKLAEMPIMLIAIIGFFTESIVIVMLAMLLMGVQSALYSPSKYGLIRDIGGVKGVSFGIGTMELLTFVGVLIGQVATGLISDISEGSVFYISLLMLVLAISGWISSKKIKAHEPAPNTNVNDTINPIKFLYASYQWSKSTKGLNYTVLGLGGFWMVASMLQMNIYLHAPGYYHMSNTQTSIVMALIAVGIGVGCWVAGLISRERAEIGMVPIGGIALSICLTVFALVDLSVTSFVILLFISAFFSGFYKVPLNAWIQQRVKGRKLGNILAYNNMVAFLFILLSAGIFGMISTMFSTTMVFVVIALISWIMTAITLLNIPSMMIRFITGSLTKFYFNFEVKGVNHIPEKGGGLLIANHQSLIDPFIISAAIPKMVRFVMAKEIYENTLVHWLVKRMNVIPVSAKLGKHQLKEFTQKCQEEINQGHLVCIFPEGQISRIGHLLEFKKGVEYISEGIKAPIIPIYLAGLKGIPFSFDIGGSRPILRLRSFKNQISVNIGEAIYHKQSAYHLRQRIQELTAEAFANRIKDHHTLPYFLERKANNNDGKAIVFGKEKQLTYKQLLDKSHEISETLKRKFPQYQNLGVCLSDPLMQVLLNIGIAITGKTSVNIESQQIKKLEKECDVFIVSHHSNNVDIRGVTEIHIDDIIRQDHLDDPYKPDADVAISKSNIANISFDYNEMGEEVKVGISHQNILASVNGLIEIFKVQQGKRILSTIPLNTAYGYNLNIWLPLLTGLTIVITNDKNDAKDLLAEIIDQKVNILFTNAQTVHEIFSCNNQEVWTSIEMIVTGEEVVDETIKRKLTGDFDISIHESMGTTTFGSLIAVGSPNYDLKDITGKPIEQLGNNSESYGRPIPGIAAKAIDPKNNKGLLGPGEFGKITVKGPALGRSFTKNNNTSTWQQTEIEGAIDQNGFIVIENRIRKKDLSRD